MTDNLKVNPEYASLVSPLSDADYQALKQSIERHGLYNPIIVSTSGIILDGHNRYRACQELGLQPKIEVKSFEDVEAERIFVIEANLKRRQLSDIERIDLVRKLEPLEGELARKRQLAHLKTGNEDVPSSPNEQDGESGAVRGIMADKAGVSPTTYYRGKTVLEKAPQEVVEQVRKGAISINQGYKQVRPGRSTNKEPRKFIVLREESYADMINAIDEAAKTGQKHLRLIHDGHAVLQIGEVEVEIATT
jgi:hypothetical protein